MEETNSVLFGRQIKEHRKQQGLTQLQLAAVTNTSARFISYLENGNPNVRLDKALHVAKMLGITSLV